MNIVLQQSAFPDYRQETLTLLGEHWGSALTILVGRVAFDPSTRTRIDLPKHVRYVDNRYLLGRRLLWQRHVVLKAIGADSAILELNPRILSVWLVLAIRKLLRRPTVLWGHVWSRSGPTSRTNLLRDCMRRLADVQLVYTDSERLALAGRTPSAQVVVAPNAIYREADYSATVDCEPSDIIYVGRLISAKKPMLLLRAFSMAVTLGLPQQTQLIFVGSGPLGEALMAEIRRSVDLSDRVKMLGHIPPGQLQGLYSNAFVSVSPGYVGLSATQSFSFGVPMIVARDEPHAPEIEAIVDGQNAVFVNSDDPAHLADAICEMFDQRTAWMTKRPQIANSCRETYSVERMADGIIRSVSLSVNRQAT